MALADFYLHGRDTIATIIFDFALILNYICTIMLFFIAIFIIKEFTNSQSPIRSGYYVFILISCITHIIVFIIYRSCETFAPNSSNSLVLSLEGICLWYHSFNMGFATTILAINRFTALIFPTRYQQIWNKYVTFILGILVVFYPVIVDIPTFFNPCKFLISPPSECKEYSFFNQLYASIHTGFNAILSLFIIISALVIAHHRKSITASKIEVKLLFQSIISSIMLTAFALTQFFAVIQMNKGNDNGYRILNNSSDIFHTVYHFNYIIISFIASPSFRHEFVNFYKLNLCFKRLAKLSSVTPPLPKNQLPPIVGAGAAGAVGSSRVEPYKCSN